MAKAVVTASLVACGLTGALLALAAAAGGDNFVVPGSKAAGLEHCVEPTAYMRRNHFELIEHQRDETVHRGIRSTKHSLAGCVACHVSYNEQQVPTPVNGHQQFCDTCHEFAAVEIECFGCHSAVPNGDVYGDTYGGTAEVVPPAGHEVAASPPQGPQGESRP